MLNHTVSDKLGRLFLILFMLDVLFMPYFLPVPVPISGLFIPFWLLNTGVRVSAKEWVWPLLGCLAVLVSYIAGLYMTIYDQEILLSRFVNAGILIYMFTTLVVCKRDAQESFSIIIAVLQAYLGFSFILALVFFADPNTYFLIREQWTFSQNVMQFGSITVLVRYTGILSDPNNMAASTDAILAMLVFLEPRRLVRNAVLIGMAAVIVVATMSVTGLICLLIVTTSLICFSKFGTHDSTLNAAMRIAALGAIALLASGVYLVIKDHLIFQLALERVSGSDLDSRLSRWGIIFDFGKVIESALIGDGGSIFWQGRDYRPHNGHLHLIFGFGVFAYFVFVRVFFHYNPNLGVSRAIFLLILFIVFTVNVGVYEHRFSGIWVILTALYAEASRRHARAFGGKRRQLRAGSRPVLLT
jgi:hypothetical protein